MCADSKNISTDSAPIIPDYRVTEIKTGIHSDQEETGIDQTNFSGKNYEANMVIM
jgi:hypothetical protein